ncbi:MAG TPA: nucleotidyltransferase family protein, partial [Clostridiales bacterium]|nr:nucleotidyltransferase family protein [Clostridiales bacterium]
IIDKYSRAKMALENGVDLVLELPVCYATASAEYFGFGAVSLLDKLGIVDDLCFGSELGDLTPLAKIADILSKKPKKLEFLIRKFISEGNSFPVAREKAFREYLDSVDNHNIDNLNLDDPNSTVSNTMDTDYLSAALSKPNNILGIEYIKALITIASSINPRSIKRELAGYHDKELSSSDEKASICGSNNSSSVISSATAIREIIENSTSLKDLYPISNSVPQDVFELLSSEYRKTHPITIEDFGSLIKYKLMSESKETMFAYVDISEDFADRIGNVSDTHMSIKELANNLKTKNLTMTRVNRALIHSLLNIRKDNFDEYNKQGYTQYARVLGVKKESSQLLRKITEGGRIPVITKVSDARKELSPLAMNMLSEDIFAAHLYNQAVYEKYGVYLANEYKRGIVIL